MIKIEKGIPIPKARQKYPFPDMKVGDSIYVPSVAGRNAAKGWGKKHEVRFTSRKSGKGFRIWRIK